MHYFVNINTIILTITISRYKILTLGFAEYSHHDELLFPIVLVYLSISYSEIILFDAVILYDQNKEHL